MSRRGVVRASVFGSIARGEATEGSDVDFLVEFEKGRTLVDLSGLRLDLCEIFDRDVDVATRGSLHPKLRDAILRVSAAAQEVGIAAIVVHALNDRARQFYEHYGFQASPAHPMTPMLRLSSLDS